MNKNHSDPPLWWQQRLCYDGCTISVLLVLLVLLSLLSLVVVDHDEDVVSKQSLSFVMSATAFTVPILHTARTRRISNGNSNDDTNSILVLLRASQGGDFGELTSALATLDQIQQMQSSRGGGGGDAPRWSKLELPPIEDDDDDDNDDDNTFASNNKKNNNNEFVWRLDPPASVTPSCVVVFVGGAGLGQFPQVAYNELLSVLSRRLGAICLTVPYEVGLDHFALAKSTGEALRRGLLVLENEQNPSPRLPTLSLAHSLGCKLQTIYLGATSGASAHHHRGIGFLAYNNFSFSRTISMARSFAKEIRGGAGGIGNEAVLDSVFDFAEMAVGAIGVDFSPTPDDTERLIQLRYNKDLQAKTRVFRFGSDSLDSSEGFRRACDEFGSSNSSSNSDSDTNNDSASESSSSDKVSVSNLEGGHLAPVLFKFDADDLDLGTNFGGGIDGDAVDAAREAVLGGFKGASFGDEDSFEGLVDELCDWILGKPPGTTNNNNTPQLASSSSSSSSSNDNNNDNSNYDNH